MSDNHPPHVHHVSWVELMAHAIAFCAALGIAAIVFPLYYPGYQEHTNSAGEARGTFFTFCVMFAGLGPLSRWRSLRWCG